jgi:putative nucleotidyltransferase with HDIG domain
MHKPIDYSTWNFDGKGNNILPLLNESEKDIWEIALPYQDKRDDSGHAECVAYFALKLTDLLRADRRITIPAAILHDIGWSQMTKEELVEFYLPDFKEREPRLRKRHQEEGVILAKKILESIGYDKSRAERIVEIISEHDTRKGFLSLEDGIMRDADKLWRFTLPEMRIFITKRVSSPAEHYEKKSSHISEPGFFYADASREMAKIELDNTFNAYKKE